MGDKTELYRAVVSYVATTAGMLSQLDIPEILAAIEHAHTVGPILDPTLYRDKAKAMEEDAELLKAALPLWEVGKKRLAAAGRIKAHG